MDAILRGFVDRVDIWQNHGNSHYRVVDYKTGKRDFDYCDVFNGVGLQMLLYMFALQETGADLVGCDYCLTHEHSMEVGQIVSNSKMEQTGVLDDEKRKSLILDGGSLVVKIYKRKMIMDNRLFFPEGIFYEDNAVGNSYLILANHFEYIAEPLYYYYQHNTSTVHTISPKRCEDRMEAGRVMIAEAKKSGYYEKYHAELEYSFTVLHYVNTLFTYMMGVKHTKYRFLKSTVSKSLNSLSTNVLVISLALSGLKLKNITESFSSIFAIGSPFLLQITVGTTNSSNNSCL
jgi:hypothetical protein